MKGQLGGTIAGKPVAFRSAYAVSHGGKGFVLHVSSESKSCLWAQGKTTGVIGSGEVFGSLDVIPAIQSDGTQRWEITGGSYVGSSTSGFESGVLGSVHWPVDVRGANPRCPTSVRVDHKLARANPLQENKSLEAFAVGGDFTPVCCNEHEELGKGPLTIKVGGESWPLTHAGVKSEATSDLLRITRVHDPCSGVMTKEDLTLTLWINRASGKVDHLFFPLGGSASPPTDLQGDNSDLTFTRTEKDIAVQGSFDMRRGFDKPAFKVEVSGKVPLAICPSKS